MARSPCRSSWYELTENDSDDEFVPRGGLSVLGSFRGASCRREVLRAVGDGLSLGHVSRSTQTEMLTIPRGCQTSSITTHDASSLTEIHQFDPQPSSSTSTTIVGTMAEFFHARGWPSSPHDASTHVIFGQILDAGVVWPMVDNQPVFGIHFISASMAAKSLAWAMTTSHGGNVHECRTCCGLASFVGVMQIAQHKVDFCNHMPAVGAIIWLEEQRSLWLFRCSFPATRIGLSHLQQYIEFPGPKVIIRSSMRGHSIMKPMSLVQRVVRLADKVFILTAGA
jgi:hypothetical protein